jgi:hypothetical protein
LFLSPRRAGSQFSLSQIVCTIDMPKAIPLFFCLFVFVVIVFHFFSSGDGALVFHIGAVILWVFGPLVLPVSNLVKRKTFIFSAGKSRFSSC